MEENKGNINSNKVNYYDKFVEQYKEIRKNSVEKPSLLLHVCCGACSAYPLVFLSELFNITILFSNSNIYPYEEYDKRLLSLKKYVNEFNVSFKTRISIIEDKYNYEEFKKDLAPFKDQKEGLTRCEICIKKRMTSLFNYAKEKGFKYVTTVMTVSRNKNVEYINRIGEELAKSYEGITYVYTDFKKNNGQDIGVKIAKKFDIYRQSYCGCEFSLPYGFEHFEIGMIVSIHHIFPYLKKCLDSIVNQNINVAFRAYLILDNATHEEKELCNEYLNKYPDIFIIHNVNFNNLSDTRNFGVKNANVRFLTFVDGDDYLENNYLSRLYETIVKENADIVSSGFYKEIKGKDKKSKLYMPRFMNNHSKIAVAKDYMRSPKTNGFAWNKMFKKDFLIKNNIFFLDFKECNEDLFFNFIAVLCSNKIKFIKDPLYHYVIRNDAASNLKVDESAQKNINTYFLCKYYSFKNDQKEASSISFFPMNVYYTFKGLTNRENLNLRFRAFKRSINKQFKKLNKNTFMYEGESWEKGVFLYEKKYKDNFYGK